jgi:hypothetical protein
MLTPQPGLDSIIGNAAIGSRRIDESSESQEMIMDVGTPYVRVDTTRVAKLSASLWDTYLGNKSRPRRCISDLTGGSSRLKEDGPYMNPQLNGMEGKGSLDLETGRGVQPFSGRLSSRKSTLDECRGHEEHPTAAFVL